jgi:hypothetical protein
LRALSLVLVATVGIACAPRDRDVRLERLASERRSLEAALDRLEDRLLANQARVRFWREMRARHERASAVACAALGEHAVEMASHEWRQRSSLHRARVAAAGPGRAQLRARTVTRARN